MKDYNKKINAAILKFLADSQDRGGKIQTIQRIQEALLANGVAWDEIILSLSNIAFAYMELAAKEKSQPRKNAWRKRLMVLHDSLESSSMKHEKHKQLAAIAKLFAPEEEILQRGSFPP